MIDSCPALCVFDQVNSNTPDSVFEMLEYLKELLLFLYQNYILPALAYISDLLQRAWTNLQESCNGEVSVSCLQGHALSFTNSTWQLLQHTTSAIKTWAQELLRRAWSQMLTNLHTHEVTHTYIYIHTHTDPTWGCLSVHRIPSKVVIGHWGQTNKLSLKRTLLSLV